MSTSQRASQQPLVGVNKFPLAVPRLGIKHLWLLVPLLIVVWMGFMHPLRQLDFWWHLKMGEIIVTSEDIPRVDLFSFTQAGEPFVLQMWLGEATYYLTYRLGGFALLIAANTALLLLALIPVYHLCLEMSGRTRVGVLSALIAAFVLGLYSNLRPQTYSIALFSIFYWVLWGYREGRRDYLWTLPLLMAVWVNLHGAFVLGIGLIGLVLISEAIRRTVRESGVSMLKPRALAKLGLVLGLTLVATLANPEAHRIYAYVRDIQASGSVQLFTEEWQVPNIKNVNDVFKFFGPFLLLILTLLYSRRRLDLTELSLLLAFAVLGLSASRNGIWFTLIAVPLLARHAVALDLSDLLGELRGSRFVRGFARLSEHQEPAKRPSRYRLNWAILAVLLLFTIVLSPWIRPHLAAEGLRPRLIEKGTPVGAMDYIAAADLAGNIFHPQEYGDYLIWRLWPQQRSFFDGRVHLYDEEFVRDYILTFHDEHWERRLAKYDVQYLLLPKDGGNAQSIVEDARRSANWNLLYEDEISVLYENRS